MPWRPPSHRALTASRATYDHAYSAERAAVHGPDPRSTARWRRLRTLVLNRHPLCADPFALHAAWGRVEPATEVDHIVPVWERVDLAFEEGNLQGLCRGCHSRKSAGERKGQTIRHGQW